MDWKDYTNDQKAIYSKAGDIRNTAENLVSFIRDFSDLTCTIKHKSGTVEVDVRSQSIYVTELIDLQHLSPEKLSKTLAILFSALHRKHLEESFQEHGQL